MLVDYPQGVTNFMVESDNGILLDTYYLQNTESNKCIILCHGNYGNVTNNFDIIKFIYTYASVIVFDYRAYGKSSGHVTNIQGNDLINDTINVWKHVVNRIGINPNNVSFFGHSLGCSVAIGVVTQLSMMYNCACYPDTLILVAPFYSLESMIKFFFDRMNLMGILRHLGSVLSIIGKGEYQSDKWIQYINHNTKIVFVHSINDEMIPYSEGIRLYELAASFHPNVRFIGISGSHNIMGITDEYIYTMAKLFDE